MKQVIIMRTDLNMSIGKMIAQAGHAIAASPKGAGNISRITVGVETEKTLLKLARNAHEAGLPHYTVQDSGKTEVPPGSYTCCVIGPADERLINPITEHLKLLK